MENSRVNVKIMASHFKPYSIIITKAYSHLLSYCGVVALISFIVSSSLNSKSKEQSNTQNKIPHSVALQGGAN